MTQHRRIGVFGWGMVAPKSPTWFRFDRNLEYADTWLSPYSGYGQSNFLVGYPEFDFDTYRAWFDERFLPRAYGQLKEKMGPMVQYAIGAFIQSPRQNPGIETYLQSLGTKCHVYVGTGMGESPSRRRGRLRVSARCGRWNEFWGSPQRCAALRAHNDGTSIDPNAPRNPSELSIGSEEWIETKYPWKRTGRRRAMPRRISPEAREIHAEPVPPARAPHGQDGGDGDDADRLRLRASAT